MPQVGNKKFAYTAKGKKAAKKATKKESNLGVGKYSQEVADRTMTQKEQDEMIAQREKWRGKLKTEMTSVGSIGTNSGGAVAPESGKSGRQVINYLQRTNAQNKKESRITSRKNRSRIRRDVVKGYVASKVLQAHNVIDDFNDYCAVIEEYKKGVDPEHIIKGLDLTTVRGRERLAYIKQITKARKLDAADKKKGKRQGHPVDSKGRTLKGQLIKASSRKAAKAAAEAHGDLDEGQKRAVRVRDAADKAWGKAADRELAANKHPRKPPVKGETPPKELTKAAWKKMKAAEAKEVVIVKDGDSRNTAKKIRRAHRTHKSFKKMGLGGDIEFEERMKRKRSMHEDHRQYDPNVTRENEDDNEYRPSRADIARAKKRRKAVRVVPKKSK